MPQQRIGIIGGSGVERPETGFTETIVDTPYGQTLNWIGEGEHADVVFLSRHGVEHDVPPHRVNYRANVKALQILGVDRVIASFAVGGIAEDIPPGGVVALDQIIDLTSGRDFTFFDGGASGLRHTPFTEPFSPGLREAIVARGADHGLTIRSNGTYICTNGPRFETAAEIRVAKVLGGDVVGMTAMPEAILARELEIHYAGIAVSVNWAAGIKGPLQVDFSALESIRGRLLPLMLDVLRTAELDAAVWSQESGD